MQRPGRHPARGGGDGRAQAVEGGQPELEPLALGAETVGRRHAAVFERDLAERVRRREHEGAHELEPGRVGCDHERRDPFVALPPVGGGEDGVKVCDPGVRNECFRAAQDVARAVTTRGRRDRCRVRARFGLGHRERCDGPAREHPGKPALLERRVARQEDRHRAEGLEREHGVGKRGGARQGLTHQARRAQIELSDRREPARPAEARHEVARLGAPGGVVGGLRECGDFACRVRRDPRRQGHVGFGQEGGDDGRIGHGQTNLGSRFALKAS